MKNSTCSSTYALVGCSELEETKSKQPDPVGAEVRKERKEKKNRTSEMDEDETRMLDHDDSDSEMHTSKRKNLVKKAKE